jgi:hypothetical protein
MFRRDSAMLVRDESNKHCSKTEILRLADFVDIISFSSISSIEWSGAFAEGRR